MAGQKARIDKDSKQYLDKDARPDAEQETAYKTNKELEAKADAGDEPGPVPVNFHGGTKKDRSRRADQVTAGTTGIGDTGTGLEKMESSNPFASVIHKKFGLSESENPGVASAPATSDAPSLGMYSVNNTDFRQQKIDVRHVLESIALQAAETFEMLDENSNVPDPIINDLQTTAKAVSKIYEYVNKNTMSDTGDPNDTSSVPKETPQGKPGVNEEAEELDEAMTPLEKAQRKHDRIKKELDDATEWTKRKTRYISSNNSEVHSFSPVKAAKFLSPILARHDKAKRELAKAKKDAGVNEEVQNLDEKLIGNQDKIDANKNGKLDAHDFKLLRSKKNMKEAVDIVFAEILRGKLDADN